MNRRQLAIGLAPIAAEAIALAAVWSQLPAKVATHWDASGAADGFTDKSVGLVALALGFPLLVGTLLALVMRLVPAEAPFLAGARTVPVAMVWFLTTVFVTSIVTQVDGDTGSIGLSLALGVVAALLGGIATHRLRSPGTPLPARTNAVPTAAPRLDQPADDVRWWSGEATSPAAPIMLGGVAVGVVSAIVGLIVIDSPVVVIAGLIVAATGLVVAATMSYDVTIGSRQVLIASRLWRPRLRIPIDAIAFAEVTDERPFSWGGWGIRSAGGRTGVIVRAGDAVQIERTDGHRVVVTVDDAHQAAATINTLIERHDAAAG